MRKLLSSFLLFFVSLSIFASGYFYGLEFDGLGYQVRYRSASDAGLINSGNDEYTKLLLHFDGSDGSTTFTDSSSSAHTVTPSGNAQLDTAYYKFGTASGLFDGSGDLLTTPDSEDWNFGSDDFTIEGWVRLNADSTGRLAGQASSGGGNCAFDIYYEASDNKFKGAITTDGSTRTTASTTGTLSLNTFHHIAFIRHGNNLYVALDGTLGTAADVTGVTVYNSGESLGIGSLGAYSSQTLNGWIDEVRISNYARWTEDFTPPDGPYQ